MFRHHNKRSRGQNGEEGQTTGKLLFDLEKAIREQQGQLRQTKNSKSPNQALLAAKAGEAYIELLREKQAIWKELCQKKEEEAEATINKLEQDWKTEIEARQGQLVVPRTVTTEAATQQFDQRQVEQWLEERLEAQRVVGKQIHRQINQQSDQLGEATETDTKPSRLLLLCEQSTQLKRGVRTKDQHRSPTTSDRPNATHRGVGDGYRSRRLEENSSSPSLKSQYKHLRPRPQIVNTVEKTTLNNTPIFFF